MNHRANIKCEKTYHQQLDDCSWVDSEHKLLARCKNCDCIFDVNINNQNKEIRQNIEQDFDDETENEIPWWARPTVKKATVSVVAFLAIFSISPAFAATSTFYPTSDARTGNNATNVTWATLISQAADEIGTTDASLNIAAGGATSTTDRYEFVSHGFFTFDTSTIPDTATIDAAAVCFYVNSKTDALGLSWSLVEAALSSPPTITMGDHLNYGTTQLATAKIIGSLSTADYNCFTLNTSGEAAINKTAYTQFTTIWDKELSGSPTWASGQYALINISMSESSGTSQDPYLLVDWTEEEEPTEPPTGSGSLFGTGGTLMFETYCDSFEEFATGSGTSSFFCDHYSTSVKISALRFFVDGSALVYFQVGTFFATLYILYKWGIVIIRYWWNLLTLKRKKSRTNRIRRRLGHFKPFTTRKL